MVIGASTVAEATAALRALSPDLRVGDVYFVGHGATWPDDGPGFFFGGHDPTPLNTDNLDFAGSDDQILTLSGVGGGGAASREFARTLGSRMAEGTDHSLEFRSCFTGAGGRPDASDPYHRFLSNIDSGYAGDLRARLGAFRDYYEIADGGAAARVVDIIENDDHEVVEVRPISDWALRPTPQTTRTTAAYDRAHESATTDDPLDGIEGADGF